MGNVSKPITWRKPRIYLNDVEYWGTATEGSVELKRKFVDVKAAGLPADAQVPNGQFEAVTAKVKLDTVAPGHLREQVAEGGYVSLRLVGECRVLNATTGLEREDSLATKLAGWVENVTLPTVGSDRSEGELTLNVMFVEVKDDSGLILLIDIANGIVYPEELL